MTEPLSRKDGHTDLAAGASVEAYRYVYVVVKMQLLVLRQVVHSVHCFVLKVNAISRK
jgi:hypothetical protein